MPGLVGIISTELAAKRDSDLSHMVSQMHHEAFYSSDTMSCDTGRLSLGWTTYNKGSQFLNRVRTEQGDILVICGEIFGECGPNRQEIERTAQIFSEDPRQALRGLNGWFNGVFVNASIGEVAVFTDRFGMRRLYYHRSSNAFLFASEAKALLAVRKDLCAISPQSMGELLTLDCVLENRTLFSQVLTVPGAALWTFRNGELSKQETYFRPEEWEQQSALPDAEFGRRLQAVMRRVVGRYLTSDVKLAVSLTGGLDTRTIMAFADHRNSFPCYTFGGMYRENFDVKIAREVAFACGHEHHTIPLTSQFLAEFPRLAEDTVKISDGCLGACEGYELYFNKQSREVADVRVTGSYGSEVLRGTRAIKADLLTGEVINGDLYSWMDLAVSTFENSLNCNDLTFSVFRQAPWYGYGRISVEQSQVLLRTPFLDNDFLALMYRAPQDARKSSALTANLIRYQDPRLAALPTDRALTGGTHGFFTMFKYLFSRLLFKADYYCKSGMPQWLEQIHYALRFLELERLVVGRHRLTFFRGWFRKELSDYVKDLLLDPASLSRPHLNPKATEAMILRHMKGDRNFTMPLQRLINLELIYRCFLERPAFDHQRRISMPEYEVAAR